MRDGIEDQASIFSQPSGDTGESWEVEGDRMSSLPSSALLPGATPIVDWPLSLGRRHDTRGRQSGLVVRRVASLRVAGVMWMKGAHILNVALGR
jgi:hypothetical protein